MTAPQLQTAGIKHLFLYVSATKVRSLEIHWDEQDPSNNHIREDDSLCDEWDDIEHFLDEEDGCIFLDRKCEVQLTNTMIEVVELVRHMVENHNPNGESSRLLELLGQF